MCGPSYNKESGLTHLFCVLSTLFAHCLGSFTYSVFFPAHKKHCIQEAFQVHKRKSTFCFGWNEVNAETKHGIQRQRQLVHRRIGGINRTPWE